MKKQPKSHKSLFLLCLAAVLFLSSCSGNSKEPNTKPQTEAEIHQAEYTEPSGHKHTGRFGYIEAVNIPDEGNYIVFMINEVFVIHPQDASLIEQFGLPKNLGGKSSVTVDESDIPMPFTADKNSTAFSVLNESGESIEITADEFIEKLKKGMYVEFGLEGDILDEIKETVPNE